MPKVQLNEKSIRRDAPKTGQIELWDRTTPGFGLRIAAGGSRTYFVMRRLNGKLVRRTVGRPPPPGTMPDATLAPDEYWPADARKRAQGMLSDLARGMDPVAQPGLTPGPAKAPNTFAEVAAAYFKDPTRRGGARLASKSELERKVRVDLKAWGERPIAGITKWDIKALLAAKRETSPVAANRLLALVKRIFAWAAREDLIEANPAANIEATEETERDRVLTLAELTRVWAAADALGYPFGPIVKLLVLTAQRRSEVAGIARSEIDGKDWRIPDARAKRGKGHLVPLSPLALSIIAEGPEIGETQLIFTTGRRRSAGGEAPPVPVSGWSRMKERLDELIAEAAAKEADEPVDMAKHRLTDWTLHDIRRSVATHLRSDGTEKLTVSKILNHAEGGMTRIYDRYSADAEKRKALEAWAAKIERLCGLNVRRLDEARA